jgi:putative transposase
MTWLWMPYYWSTIIRLGFKRFAAAIGFDFRDAKQFYGLSDLKNYKKVQVTNAVNSAFTMNVVSKFILEKYKVKLNCQVGE